MTTFQITVDDAIKQDADRLFVSLGLDTATAIQIFLKAAIAHDCTTTPGYFTTSTRSMLVPSGRKHSTAREASFASSTR